MHELSIAMALVEQAERIRAAEGATAVVSLTLGLGALAGVDQEALAFAFPLAAETTPLAGARLVIEPIPAEITCDACGRRSQPEGLPLRCAGCGSDRVRISAGRDLLLRSVELQMPA